jgi:hypothetical protein
MPIRVEDFVTPLEKAWAPNFWKVEQDDGWPVTVGGAGAQLCDLEIETIGPCRRLARNRATGENLGHVKWLHSELRLPADLGVASLVSYVQMRDMTRKLSWTAEGWNAKCRRLG